jgi:hypothetical protein
MREAQQTPRLYCRVSNSGIADKKEPLLWGHIFYREEFRKCYDRLSMKGFIRSEGFNTPPFRAFLGY